MVPGKLLKGLPETGKKSIWPQCKQLRISPPILVMFRFVFPILLSVKYVFTLITYPV